MHFIQISDIHLSSISFGSPERKENVRFEGIIDWLKSRHQAGPHWPVLLFTGDVIDNALEGEFQIAAEMFQKLKDAGFEDMLFTPGNHDFERGGHTAVAEARKWWCEHLLTPFHREQDGRDFTDVDRSYPLIDEVEDTVFVGLNTSNDGFVARGHVGNAQLQRAVEAFQATPDNQFRVAYFHHHPFHRGLGMEMNDGPEVLDTLKEHVDVICFGHKHQRRLWTRPEEVEEKLDGAGRVKAIIASGKSTNVSPGWSYAGTWVEVLEIWSSAHGEVMCDILRVPVSR